MHITDAIVEKTSLPFAKRVLSISPPVPRRKGWHNDETSVFHIRFRTEEGRDEVSQNFTSSQNLIIVTITYSSI